MRLRSLFLAAALLSIGTLNLPAQVLWNTSSGVWSTASNWSPSGTPVNDGTASLGFELATNYTSSLDTSYSVQSIAIGGGIGTFTLSNSGGATLTITSGGSISYLGLTTTNLDLPILGAGSVLLNGGAGTVTLNPGSANANTYSGATKVYAGGTLADGAANSFSANSVLYVGSAAGGTVNVIYNESIASLADVAGGPGSVVISSGATLDLVGGYTGSFSGVISGGGNLQKDVTGTLTLTGANAYTGTTVINGAGGTAIQLGDGTTLGSLATSGVSGTGTLTFDEPSSYAFSGVLSGALQVIQKGAASTVTLSGTNTNSGGYTVQAGTLQAGSTSAFGGATGASDIAVSAGATLDLNNFSNTIGTLAGAGSVTLGSGNLSINNIYASAKTFTGTITGSGSLSVNTYTEDFTGANTYSGGTTITAGTLLADNPSGSATGSGNISIASGGTLQLGNVDSGKGFVNSTATITDNGTVAFARTDASTFINPISGTGGVSQFENGTTTLSGANSYSGTTEIFYGTLKAGSSSAFGGTGLSPISFTYIGTLDLNGNSNTVGSLSGGATAGNIVSITGATLTIAGTSSSTSYKGIIQGASGNLALTGSGSVQVLDGANTYTGTTTIGTGETLQIGDGVVLGATINQSSSVLDNGTLRFSPGLSDAGAYGGIISGSGAVVVNGANDGTNIGSLTLSNANTYSGGTQVIGGELFVGSSTTGSAGAVLSGPVGKGTLTFSNNTEFSPSASVTLANAIVFNGSVDNDDGGSNSMTLSGLISGAGTYSWCTWSALNIIGSGNTFSGTMDMREGYLYLGSDTALGNSSVILDGGTSIDAYGSGVTRSIPNAINITSSTAQIGNGNNNNLTFSGVIAGSGPAVITIDNGPSGSVTFSGANTLSGTGTTFDVNNAGTVYAANNSAFGAAANTVTLQGGSTLNVLGGVTIQNPVTIGTGANTLAGSGTLTNGGSSVTITNNAILSPSASPGGGPGELTFTTPLVFVGGAIHFQLYDAAGAAGTGWGLITASGGMDFSGASANSITFNVVSVDASGNSANTLNFNPASSYSWTFATSPTTITGFNAADFHIIASGFTNGTGGGSFSVSQAGNNLDLNFTPVPEPSTWALMGAGVIALGIAGMRRRRFAKT